MATDRDGFRLPDEQIAREMAVRAIRDMASDELPDGEHLSLKALLRDDAGSLLYTAVLTFEGRWERSSS